MKRFLIVFGTLVAAAAAAHAGGLSDVVVEMAPPAPVEEVAPASGSIPGWVIPLAIIGLMVGLAASGSDDDDDETLGV